MKKITVVLLNILFGLIVSVIVPTSIISVSGFFTGGMMNLIENKWMYMTLVIPITICFGVLGAYFYNHPNLSNKQMWKITLISVLSISLFSGMFGTIVSDAILYGIEGINYDGRIIWGLLYSLLPLPITLVMGKLFIEISAELVSNLKNKNIAL